jgi:hypothetical protein
MLVGRRERRRALEEVDLGLRRLGVEAAKELVARVLDRLERAVALDSLGGGEVLTVRFGLIGKLRVRGAGTQRRVAREIG